MAEPQEEPTDGSGEKNSKNGSSTEKGSEMSKKSDSKETNEDSNEPGGEREGDDDDDDDEDDEKDREKRDQSGNIETETDQSEDDESDLEEYSGDYSEADQPEKQMQEIKKARKKHYRPRGDDISEEEPEVIQEIPKTKPARSSRRRSKGEESEEMAQRSDEEKEILHNYYTAVGHSKAYHGKLEPGSVIEQFTEEEQKVIRKFLHQIGQKGRRARTRYQEESEAEEQKESTPVQTPRKSVESPEMAKRSEEKKRIIKKYYHDIGQQRGEKAQKGSVIDKYSPKEKFVIREFLQEIGGKGRKGRKLKDKDYNRRDIDLYNEQEKAETKEQEEVEKPRTSKESPMKKTYARKSSAGVQEQIEKEKESESEQFETQTPKKRGRPKKSESAQKHQKKRKSLEKQRGDVEIKEALKKVEEKKEKENEPLRSETIEIKVEGEKKPRSQKTPFAQRNPNVKNEL